MSEKTDTFKRLDEHRKRAQVLPFTIKEDRIAITSDIHKWDRSEADFFRKNDEIYYYALDYYRQNNFKLVLNGDIEELAGSPPHVVMANYKKTFEKEKEFVEKGDCYRIYGNHDHDWKSDKTREEYLKPVYGTIPQAFPAIVLGDKIIILHGHEGDLFSDEIRGFTKWILRLGKRAAAILTGKSPRAAENYQIRSAREKYLFEWAKENRLLLIAGHTHRPIFVTESILSHLNRKKEELSGQLKAEAKGVDVSNLEEELKTANMFIEELKEKFDKDEEITVAAGPTPPNFFNCGCGLFKESITAIEIDRGWISLIRWYRSDGQIKRDWTFLKKDLSEILNRI